MIRISSSGGTPTMITRASATSATPGMVITRLAVCSFPVLDSHRAKGLGIQGALLLEGWGSSWVNLTIGGFAGDGVEERGFDVGLGGGAFDLLGLFPQGVGGGEVERLQNVASGRRSRGGSGNSGLCSFVVGAVVGFSGATCCLWGRRRGRRCAG